MKRFLPAAIFLCGITLIVARSAGTTPASDKIVWKPIPQVVLRVDDSPPKVWNLYRTGKKADPLLLQLGTRFLVLYIHNEEAYELKPEVGSNIKARTCCGAKRTDLKTDSDFRLEYTGRWLRGRIRVKLAAEGRLLEIEIPQLPDLRGIY